MAATECKLLSLEVRNIAFGIRGSKEVREGLDLFEHGEDLNLTKPGCQLQSCWLCKACDISVIGRITF